VFGAAFDRSDEAQDLALLEAVADHQIGQFRAAKSQRSGLVEGDHLSVAQALERVALAEQHAHFGRPAGADHDRGRGGQPHGAGTGDDQHGDRIDQREVSAGAGPKASQVRKVSTATP
jgi:hypothetical protein